MPRKIKLDAPIPIARAPRDVVAQIANAGATAAGWPANRCDGCVVCRHYAMAALSPMRPGDDINHEWPAYRRAARLAARMLGVEVR